MRSKAQVAAIGVTRCPSLSVKIALSSPFRRNQRLRARSRACVARCKHMASFATRESGSVRVRPVFGALRATPTRVCESECRIVSVPASTSYSSHQSPQSSPRCAPVASASVRKASHRLPRAASRSRVTSSAVSAFASERRMLGRSPPHMGCDRLAQAALPSVESLRGGHVPDPLSRPSYMATSASLSTTMR